jgi:hypothetical protein
MMTCDFNGRTLNCHALLPYLCGNTATLLPGSPCRPGDLVNTKPDVTGWLQPPDSKFIPSLQAFLSKAPDTEEQRQATSKCPY